MNIYIQNLAAKYALPLSQLIKDWVSLDQKEFNVMLEVTKLEAYSSGVIIFIGDFNLMIPCTEYRKVSIVFP